MTKYQVFSWSTDGRDELECEKDTIEKCLEYAKESCDKAHSICPDECDPFSKYLHVDFDGWMNSNESFWYGDKIKLIDNGHLRFIPILETSNYGMYILIN